MKPDEKKVLFCASRTSHLARFHQPYLTAFARMGWQVDTVSQGEEVLGDVSGQFLLPFHKSWISPGNLSTLFRLTRLLQKERYDLLIGHTTLASFLLRTAAVLSRQKHSRLVQVCHGYLFRDDDSFRSRLYRSGERVFHKRVDCLLVMNGEDEAIARKYRFCRIIHRIPGMGLELRKLVPQKSGAEIRRNLEIGPKEKMLLCVGEFSRRKNQFRLLQGFASLPTEGVRLVFAGEGNRLEACRRFAAGKQLGNRVLFLGERTDVPSLLEACDGLVTASRSEGLPFSVMEALAMGKPVVASEVKGHRELVENGKTGLLFRLETEQEPAETLTRFLRTPAEHWQKADVTPWLLETVQGQVMVEYLKGGTTE